MTDKISPAGRLDILVKSLALAILASWTLYIGQGILLPIILALISAYVITAASDALGRWRATSWLPLTVRRLVLFLLFVGLISALAAAVASAVQEMVVTAPSYQDNLERVAGEVAKVLHLETTPDLQKIRAATLGQIRLQTILGTLAGSVGSFAGMIFLAFVYTIFLMGERGSFAHKLSVALPQRESARQTAEIIRGINERIGDYLAVKTLINLILGAISYVILSWFAVDYALFWAIVIALLNYIPYVGSMLGVAFPVLLTVAQFGSLRTTLLVAAALVAAQAWVGNFLEPKMIARRVNLSPFVVLVALSVWSALWGIAGAILAIPLTSVLAIIFAAFAPTRPLAVMLAQDVSVFEDQTAP